MGGGARLSMGKPIRARQALKETMAPASEAVDARSDEIDPTSPEIQARFASRKSYSDLTAEQHRAEMTAAYKWGPCAFADRIAAVSAAQAAGMARYAEIMLAAVEEFLWVSKR
jgi:hypothetical protein